MNVENAYKKVKGNIERLFEKNLTDLIRGIRNNRENEVKYITQCIDEIKLELKQDNLSVKSNAILKLIYLEMLGYNIHWAAFNIIEVMSSTKFTHKRIGYLSAAQSFNPDIDVLMLTTNLIKKDINSSNQYEAAIALNGLSCFITSDLARDLAHDITSLMSSTKPYIRKRAILMMYKIFLNYPEALDSAFAKMREKLEDPDQSVQSAVVNVICEMARRNPKNYLSLAPIFFKLMTNSTNNWMLIKIIKLFGTLTPIEPRLGKRLMEPLTNLIHSTSAMSLLYECINTLLAVLVSISSGQPNHSASIQLCLQKLRILIEDSDQNLKYLGLLAMAKILKSYPKNVQAHKDIVLKCLDDKDDSIRIRALHLLYGMVNKKNLVDISKTLLTHLCTNEGPQSYKDDLLKNIINVCNQNNYQYITDFEWYLNVLIEFSKLDTPKNIDLIASQLLDVTIRVPSLRKFSVNQMEKLLDNSHLFSNKGTHKRMSELLYVVAYICGEYSQYIENPELALKNMIDPRVLLLTHPVQAVFLLNAIKVYGRIFKSTLENLNPLQKGEYQNLESSNNDFMTDLNGKDNDEPRWSVLSSFGRDAAKKLEHFSQSNSVEVQERALSFMRILQYIQQCVEDKNVRLSDGDLISNLFKGDMNPVALKAQKKVPIPEGLDLEAPINPDFQTILSKKSGDGDWNAYKNLDIFAVGIMPKVSDDKAYSFSNFSTSSRSESSNDESNVNDISVADGALSTDMPKTKIKKRKKLPNEKHSKMDDKEANHKEMAKVRKARLEEQANNPHYLKSKPISNDKLKIVDNHTDIHDAYDVLNGLDYIGDENEDPILNLRKLSITNKSHGNFDGQKIQKADYNGTDTHKVEILDYELPENALSSPHSSEDRENKYINRKKKAHKEAKNSSVSEKILNQAAEKFEHQQLKNDSTKKSSPKKRHKEKKGKSSKDVMKEKKIDGNSPSKTNELLLIYDHADGEVDFDGSVDNTKTVPLKEEKRLEDLDFWLSPTRYTSNIDDQNMLNVSNDTEMIPSLNHHKKHKKKSSKSNFKDQISANNDMIDILDGDHNNDIQKSKLEIGKEIPRYKSLIKDENLKLTYSTFPELKSISLSSLPPRLLVRFLASNHSPARSLLKNLEISVRRDDSTYSTLSGSATLPPSQTTPFEMNFELPFAVAVRDGGFKISDIKDKYSHLDRIFESETSHDFNSHAMGDMKTISNVSPKLALKGCITYISVNGETSLSHKLDFKLNLPTSDFVMSCPISNSQFSQQLMDLGTKQDLECQLTFRVNTKLEALFSQIIKILTTRFHFYMVEKIDGNPRQIASSLYCKSVLNQEIFLLIKLTKVDHESDTNACLLSLNGKSQSSSLLNDLIEQEIKPYLLRKFEAL